MKLFLLHAVELILIVAIAVTVAFVFVLLSGGCSPQYVKAYISGSTDAAQRIEADTCASPETVQLAHNITRAGKAVEKLEGRAQTPLDMQSDSDVDRYVKDMDVRYQVREAVKAAIMGIFRIPSMPWARTAGEVGVGGGLLAFALRELLKRRKSDEEKSILDRLLDGTILAVQEYKDEKLPETDPEKAAERDDFNERLKLRQDIVPGGAAMVRAKKDKLCEKG